MKIIYTFFTTLFVCSISYSQIGIGTLNPQADLHVAGDLLIRDDIKVGSLQTAISTDQDFKLIAWSKDSNPVGEIKVLDVTTTNVAPVNIIDYHFTDISLDNLTDVDLQYDSTKYIVGISNFRYVGDAIAKQNGVANKSIGQFVVRSFESNGTWHLEIRNRSLDLDVADTLEYYVTLVVYDKSYYRYLPVITTDLGGSNVGTASSIPVFN